MFAFVLVAVMGVGAGAGVMMARRAEERAGGSVIADATPVGTFSFGVNDCASGEALERGFFGVELRGEADCALRVVGTGDDAELWLYPQGVHSGAIQIRKDDCTEWDVRVDRAGVTVDDVSTVSGHVLVACAIGGGKLTAVADFERCAR